METTEPAQVDADRWGALLRGGGRVVPRQPGARLAWPSTATRARTPRAGRGARSPARTAEGRADRKSRSSSRCSSSTRRDRRAPSARCPTAPGGPLRPRAEGASSSDLDAPRRRAVRRLRRGAVRPRLARPGPPRAHDRRRRGRGQGAAPGRRRGRRGRPAQPRARRPDPQAPRAGTRRAARVLAELRERISDELDYEVEAQHQRRLERRFRGHPHVRVPRVHTGPVGAPRAGDRVRRRAAGRRDQRPRRRGARPHRRDRLPLLLRPRVARRHRRRRPASRTTASLCPDGRLCLLDFGLLRDLEPDYRRGRARHHARARRRRRAGRSRRPVGLGYLPDPEAFDPDALLEHLGDRRRVDARARLPPDRPRVRRPDPRARLPAALAVLRGDAPHEHAAADAAAAPHGAAGARAARRAARGRRLGRDRRRAPLAESPSTVTRARGSRLLRPPRSPTADRRARCSPRW